MMNEPVQSIMTKNPITVSPNASLYNVRQIFMTNRIHHLPVVDSNNHLIGLLTTYDLWKNEIAPAEYQQVKVYDVMTTRIAKISASDKIGTAAEIFLDNRFHALPVINEENKLQGIVTSHDVLKYEFLKAYPKPILFREILLQNGMNRVSA